MRFMMLDGPTYIGRSYEDIVGKMLGDKLVKPRSRARYRRATARRASEAYNVAIDASNDRRFVRTLEAAGLLVRLRSEHGKAVGRRGVAACRRALESGR